MEELKKNKKKHKFSSVLGTILIYFCLLILLFFSAFNIYTITRTIIKQDVDWFGYSVIYTGNNYLEEVPNYYYLGYDETKRSPQVGDIIIVHHNNLYYIEEVQSIKGQYYQLTDSKSTMTVVKSEIMGTYQQPLHVLTAIMKVLGSTIVQACLIIIAILMVIATEIALYRQRIKLKINGQYQKIKDDACRTCPLVRRTDDYIYPQIAVVVDTDVNASDYISSTKITQGMVLEETPCKEDDSDNKQ